MNKPTGFAGGGGFEDALVRFIEAPTHEHALTAYYRADSTNKAKMIGAWPPLKILVQADSIDFEHGAVSMTGPWPELAEHLWPVVGVDRFGAEVRVGDMVEWHTHNRTHTGRVLRAHSKEEWAVVRSTRGGFTSAIYLPEATLLDKEE